MQGRSAKNLKARKGMAALTSVTSTGSMVALAPSAAYAADKGSDQTPKSASVAKVQKVKTKISKITRDYKLIAVTRKKLSSSKADGCQVRYATNSVFKKAKKVKAKKVKAKKALDRIATTSYKSHQTSPKRRWTVAGAEKAIGDKGLVLGSCLFVQLRSDTLIMCSKWACAVESKSSLPWS